MTEEKKVIEFPKHKVVREVPEEQLIERARKSDQKMADSIANELAAMVVAELDNYEFDVNNKEFAKDFILVVESIRSVVYRQYDIEHHLHDFIDQNVKILEGDVEGLSDKEIHEKIVKMIEELNDVASNLDTEGEE